MTSTPARGPVDATVPPLRRPRHLRPAAPPRRGGARRRRRRRRAVRLRRDLPAGRPVRPGHIRASSRLLRPYNPVLDVAPFAVQQVADAGDIAVQPVRHRRGRSPRSSAAPGDLPSGGAELVTIGGDHTIALPLLRAVARDARPGRRRALRRPPGHLGHLLRAPLHPRHAVPPGRRGGPARHRPRCLHVGIRGPLYGTRGPGRRRRCSASRSSAPTTTGRPRRGAGSSTQMRARRRRPPGLRLGRHRRARPGPRPGHRHPRGRRPDQPRAAAASCAAWPG